MYYYYLNLFICLFYRELNFPLNIANVTCQGYVGKKSLVIFYTRAPREVERRTDENSDAQ